MTDLQARLDSIQDRILTLYESNSTNLADHLQFYLLSRQEHALLYVARQKGIKLAMPLPALATSKARARESIEMSLLIESLLNSPFGNEAWTLPEVSRERLLAPPKYCFKKDGAPIQVQFGDDPDNVVEYTTWGWIYFQDTSDEWYKVPGKIDLDGLSYKDSDGDTVYYVSFKEEARKMGTPDKWSLLYDSNLLAFSGSPSSESSSSSSSSSSFERGRTKTRSSSRESRVWWGRPRSVSESRSRSRTRSRSRSRRRTRSRSRSRTKSPTPPSNLQQRRRDQRQPSAGTTTTSSGPILRQNTAAQTQKGQKRTTTRRRSPGARGVRPGNRPSFVVPEQVGSSLKTVSSGPGGRLGQLLREARDPPGLCLRGPANTLKCYRYSLKKHHPTSCTAISTTWKWTDSGNTTRLGDGRMLLLFDTAADRDIFLKTIHIPKTLSYYFVEFGGI